LDVEDTFDECHVWGRQHLLVVLGGKFWVEDKCCLEGFEWSQVAAFPKHQSYDKSNLVGG
jgi:hypothetical protein